MRFYDQVYQMVRQIPKGRVASYGQIALLCGNPKASRAVGWALHLNPEPGVIPCHRVVNAAGRLAPGFAFGGQDEQRRLLESEGVAVSPEGFVEMKRYAWYGAGSGRVIPGTPQNALHRRKRPALISR